MMFQGQARRMCLTFTLALALQTVSNQWITMNFTHFCSTARNCLVSAANGHTQLSDDNFRVSSWKQEGICTALYNCVNGADRSNSADRLIQMRKDKELSCRLIFNCESKRTLITESTIDPGYWCPYSNFCQHKSSNPLISSSYAPVISCCSSCSCGASCGRKNNCCYKHNDTYDAIESESLKCVKSEYMKEESFGFYLRDTCKNGTKCRHTNKFIIPASSQTHRRFYVSEQCGKCNGADDAQSLMPHVECINEWEANMFITGYDHITTCHPSLYPPHPDVNEWIDDFICPDEVISLCNPEYENQAVIDACHTTNARVQVAGRFYANIYCVACNFVFLYDRTLRCHRFKELSFFDRRTTTFSMRLDPDVVHSHQRRLQADAVCGQDTVTIIHLNHTGCRPLLCPSGMVRTENGTCRYAARLWLDVESMITLSLRLQHGMLIPAETIRDAASSNSRAPWLISPCSMTGYVHVDLCMFTNNQSEVELIDELVVRIYSVQNKAVPAEHISRFAKCLHSTWKLDLAGKQYHLTASFSRYEVEASSSSTWQIEYASTSEDKQTCQPFTIVKTAHGQMLGYSRPNTIIKKLHFCNQIDVYPNETELGPSRHSLRLLHNNVTLGTNFFGILFDEDGVGYVARVCVEDYQYTQTYTSAASVSLYPVIGVVLLIPSLSVTL